MTVAIVGFERPHHFRDAMVEGPFTSMHHDHHFVEHHGVTSMEDRFEYHSPMGPVGALVNWLLLTRYLRRFLATRASLLKATAESDGWRRYLPEAEPDGN